MQLFHDVASVVTNGFDMFGSRQISHYIPRRQLLGHQDLSHVGTQEPRSLVQTSLMHGILEFGSWNSEYCLFCHP